MTKSARKSATFLDKCRTTETNHLESDRDGTWRRVSSFQEKSARTSRLETCAVLPECCFDRQLTGAERNGGWGSIHLNLIARMANFSESLSSSWLRYVVASYLFGRAV